MAAFSGFVPMLLRALNAPDTPQNRLFLKLWQQAEGGTASNNPFNTTQSAPGATNYNSVGVKNFASPQQGLEATISTLKNGKYGSIVSLLQSGHATAKQEASALADSPWGTGSGVLKLLGANPTGYERSGSSGSTATTTSPAPTGLTYKQLVGDYLLQQAQAALSGHAENGGAGLLNLALARKALTAAPAAKATSSAALPYTRSLASASTKAGGFLPNTASYKPGRLDRGHDFQTNPGAPIIAPGDGVVERVASDPHGFGPAYPIVHFTNGPYAGKSVFIGHTISQLQPGQRFTAGTVLARTGTQPIGNAQVPGWAEIGFASGGTPGAFGQSPPF